MKVWTYWEGEAPPWIRVCLDSIARCCRDLEYHALDASTVWDHLPQRMISVPLSDLPNSATRADAIRAALLARHGGLWLDADTVCLRSPALLPGQDRDLVYAVWDSPPRRIFNGYIYAQPDSAIAAAWLAIVNWRLLGGQTSWTALGEGVLTPLVQRLEGYGPATTLQVPRCTFCPIDVDSGVRMLFSRGDWREHVREQTICFGLNHSWMMHRRRHDMLLPADRMANSPLLIHQLLTHAREEMAACPTA